MDIRPRAFLWALLYGQQMIIWLPVCPGSNEVGDECDESSPNEEIDDSGSMLN